MFHHSDPGSPLAMWGRGRVGKGSGGVGRACATRADPGRRTFQSSRLLSATFEGLAQISGKCMIFVIFYVAVFVSGVERGQSVTVAPSGASRACQSARARRPTPGAHLFDSRTVRDPRGRGTSDGPAVVDFDFTPSYSTSVSTTPRAARARFRTGMSSCGGSLARQSSPRRAFREPAVLVSRTVCP